MTGDPDKVRRAKERERTRRRAKAMSARAREKYRAKREAEGKTYTPQQERERKTAENGKRHSALRVPYVPGRKKQARDLHWVKAHVEDARDVLPEERRNGWTRAELAKYLTERDAAVNRQLGLGGEIKRFDIEDYYSTPHDPFDW